VVPKEENQD
jgi:hypothetical protein